MKLTLLGNLKFTGKISDFLVWFSIQEHKCYTQFQQVNLIYLVRRT